MRGVEGGRGGWRGERGGEGEGFRRFHHVHTISQHLSYQTQILSREGSSSSVRYRVRGCRDVAISHSGHRYDGEIERIKP